MAEWFKAAVLKTADRKVRGFESLSLRQLSICFSEIFTRKISHKLVIGGFTDLGDYSVTVLPPESSSSLSSCANSLLEVFAEPIFVILNEVKDLNLLKCEILRFAQNGMLGELGVLQ